MLRRRSTGTPIVSPCESWLRKGRKPCPEFWTQPGPEQLSFPDGTTPQVAVIRGSSKTVSSPRGWKKTPFLVYPALPHDTGTHHQTELQCKRPTPTPSRPPLPRQGVLPSDGKRLRRQGGDTPSRDVSSPCRGAHTSPGGSFLIVSPTEQKERSSLKGKCNRRAEGGSDCRAVVVWARSTQEPSVRPTWSRTLHYCYKSRCLPLSEMRDR